MAPKQTMRERIPPHFSPIQTMAILRLNWEPNIPLTCEFLILKGSWFNKNIFQTTSIAWK